MFDNLKELTSKLLQFQIKSIIKICEQIMSFHFSV